TEEVTMATRMLRRGLPRVKGGEAWPPAVEIEDATAPAAGAAESPSVAVSPSAPGAAESTGALRTEAVQSTGSGAADVTPAPESSTTDAAPAPSASATPVALRRGLPRVAGGDPWPPASAAPTAPVA